MSITRAATYQGGKCHKCGGVERYKSNGNCIPCHRKEGGDRRFKKVVGDRDQQAPCIRAIENARHDKEMASLENGYSLDDLID